MSEGIKSLSTLCRSIVNQNVNIENIDSLPLPKSLKDDCFINSAIDRCKEFVPRLSSDPCNRGCCNFLNSTDFKKCRLDYLIPLWSEDVKLTYDLDLFYSAILPKFPTDAEWVHLPFRDTLLKSYNTTSFGKHFLEACLNPLRFDSCTGLGQAHEWIRRYLYFQDTHGWFHVSIVAQYFKIFLKVLKNVPIVVLPYGCISENEADANIRCEQACLRKHKRHMIIVVKNNNYAYRQALKRFKKKTSFHKYFQSKKICTIKQLINTIAYVSRPRPYLCGHEDRHYIIFNPIIYHAVWWMLLLVPKGCLNDFTEYKILTETHGLKRKYCASLELGIENCIVQFDPLYQCIGDNVRDLKKHVNENKPFVYWLRGQVLNVKEIKDRSSFITLDDDPKMKFIEWCVSRGMNSMLNLNGDSWVYNKRPRRDEWSEESDECITIDDTISLSSETSDENYLSSGDEFFGNDMFRIKHIDNKEKV